MKLKAAGGLILALAASCVVTKKDNIKQLAEKATIVLIETDKALGTGVVVKQEGDSVYILTASHVVRDAFYFSFRYYIGGVEKYNSSGAELVINDTTDDIAVLVTSLNERVPVVDIRRARNPKPYSRVVSIGMAAGRIYTITEGVVAGKDGDRFVASAPAFFGNSGGPVFDKDTGELVGITLAILQANVFLKNYVAPHVHLFIGAGDIVPIVEQIL